MRFSAGKTTATTLAALLAALSCFEHGLHNVVHVHLHHAGCLSGNVEPSSGKPESCPTKGCCPHGAEGATDSSSKDQPRPTEHDPEHCLVCRLLALPQFFEPPQLLLFSDMLVADLVGTTQLSFARRVVRLVPIRGPPVSTLKNAC
jgi:hypothetical protein